MKPFCNNPLCDQHQIPAVTTPDQNGICATEIIRNDKKLTISRHYAAGFYFCATCYNVLLMTGIEPR